VQRFLFVAGKFSVQIYSQGEERATVVQSSPIEAYAK
jgi:hypothetical protein